MDIRVAAYKPSVTVSTFSEGPATTTYVQNAAQSAPVSAASAVNSAASQIAAQPNDGYTDSVRGSLINILA